MLRNRLFYTLKPVIPRPLQIAIRRQFAAYKCKKYSHIWPIDPGAGNPPDGWVGWPDGKRFALVLSHDVDTRRGHDNCFKLSEIEQDMGFCSSYNFVPERYCEVSQTLRESLVRRGFEVGVHGLKHDGKLFKTKKIFAKRAERINYYLKEWNSKGFTSPAMHHNFDWMHLLNIKHCTSTFDTDPFEPQPDGAGTIFPYWVQNSHSERGFVELPYTLSQDHALFIILQEKNASIWEKKLDWIVAGGGMALLNTHSDYMNFDGKNMALEEYPITIYEEFLAYIKTKYADQYWNALPSEIAGFWKRNMVKFERVE